MRDVTLGILNSLRIKCHIRRSLRIYFKKTAASSSNNRLKCITT